VPLVAFLLLLFGYSASACGTRDVCLRDLTQAGCSKWRRRERRRRNELARRHLAGDVLAAPAGALAVLLGRKRRSIELMQDVLRLDPDDADSRNALGNLLVEVGEPAAAVEQFKLAGATRRRITPRPGSTSPMFTRAARSWPTRSAASAARWR